jgi:hypothetical protein
MGVRGYNPYTGRFDQTDPITGSSPNAYDFGAQNPLTHFDESGKYWHLSMLNLYSGQGWIAFIITRAQWLLDRQSGYWGIFTAFTGACAKLKVWWAIAGCLGASAFAANQLAREVKAKTWPYRRGWYFKYGCSSRLWGCMPWWGFFFSYSSW